MKKSKIDLLNEILSPRKWPVWIQLILSILAIAGAISVVIDVLSR